MEKHKWIEYRAFHLWRVAGCPSGRDLEFWLKAEQGYDNHLCVLSPCQCKNQKICSTCGGKHVTICMKPNENCSNHARDYN